MHYIYVHLTNDVKVLSSSSSSSAEAETVFSMPYKLLLNAFYTVIQYKYLLMFLIMRKS